MLYITVCDQNSLNENRVNFLKKTLKTNNCNLTILTISEFSNLLSKIYYPNSYLSNQAIKDEIIILGDGFDIIANKDLKNIEEDFKKTNYDIIFGSEKCFSHHAAHAQKFFDDLSEKPRLINQYVAPDDRYLNSGFIIGYKSKIIEILNYLVQNIQNYDCTDNNNYLNDQKLWSEFLMKKIENNIFSHIKIGLDYNSVFVKNICLYTEIESVNSYFIHVPGIYMQEQHVKWIKILDNLKLN